MEARWEAVMNRAGREKDSGSKKHQYILEDWKEIEQQQE